MDIIRERRKVLSWTLVDLSQFPELVQNYVESKVIGKSNDAVRLASPSYLCIRMWNLKLEKSIHPLCNEFIEK